MQRRQSSWDPKKRCYNVGEMDRTRVSRGGDKLQAAIERFGLAPRVRGAWAVDVGASTGGFTEALLAQGAAQVTAVDVGNGQLDSKLRADSRVENLEGANWKTLALSIAPGPFDFFTVDVSFVAARNMLRALAFRLRDGAEGVVLLKPQFELPDRLVHGGVVKDEALRERALAVFTTKAEVLGFRVVAHADSPVAIDSGTVEMLLHLRFEGRTAKLPQPGEKRGARSVGDPRTPTAREDEGRTFTWFAVAAPGLEDVVRAEVQALVGAQDVRLVPGGVEFEGTREVGMRANLWLRVASRVLVRLGMVEAREFALLLRRLRTLPWGAFVAPGAAVRVSASATRCRLYHTGALAENLVLALSSGVRGVKVVKGAGEDEEGNSGLRILLRGQGDAFTVSVDSSGPLLHRRGWRMEGGKAPLRETLAAGLLGLSGYDGTEAFVDPMCGAGTIALEACALALGRAPGLGRSFAFEGWPGHGAAVWARLRDEAHAMMKARPPAAVLAFDRDPRAVEIARRNAERSGMAEHLRIECATLGQGIAPTPSGLVVLNPPYGRRLATSGARHARDMGAALARVFGGWRAGIVVPDRRWQAALKLPVRAVHGLRNGGLRIFLLGCDVPGPSRAGIIATPP